MNNKTCIGYLTNIRDMFVVGSERCEGEALKYHQNFIDALNYAIELINDTESPQGEWVGNAFDEHHCNRCGHPALWEEEPDGYYEVQSRFCPNCGAEMQEGGAE